MKFLVLTHYSSGVQVRYRADKITQYWRNEDDDKTQLGYEDGSIECVRQTPEQIDELFAKIGAQP